MSNGDDEMPILTIKETAELLRVSYEEVRRMMAAGTLPFTQLSPKKIRINRADVLALVPPGGGKPPKKDGDT